MSLGHGSNVVKAGLVCHLDTLNPKSFPTLSSNIKDVSGNGVDGVLSGFDLTTDGRGVYLSRALSGRINLPTIQNITTVELWFKMNSYTTSYHYLLDMRSGGAGGFIAATNEKVTGSNWSGGNMYINGEYFGVPDLTVIEPYALDGFCQVVVTANIPATDDINLFSRTSNNESIDVDFHIARIYNRELTSEEVKQNFEATRGRFGI